MESIRFLFSDLSKKPVQMDVLYQRLNIPCAVGYSAEHPKLSLEQILELFRMGIQDSDLPEELSSIIDSHIKALHKGTSRKILRSR